MKLTRELFPNKQYWDDDFELQVMCDNLEVEKGMKVLDLGCNDSQLAEVIQKQGCEAWGVDLRPYTDAPFKFFREDFLKCNLPENYFDVVIDISALHHFGIGYLNTQPNLVEDLDADIKTAQKVWKILKSGGLFYVSTDRFGDSHQILKGLCHQYDTSSFLERIAKYFKVLEMKYYVAYLHPLMFYRDLSNFKPGQGVQLFAKLQKVK